MKILVASCCLLLALTSSLSAAERLNVLFIAIDDLRPELGCYGATPVKSPHIDKLASDGMVFTRAYCQVPVCGASRASLLTGVLPTRTRFVHFDTQVEKDAPGAMTLPEAFKDAGYTTLSNGKIFHHRGDTQDRSWSEPAWYPQTNGMRGMSSHDPETTRRLSETRQRGRIYESPDVADDAYFDGRVAQKTIEDLRRLKKAGEPFFLACGFVKPHLPFYAPKRYWDLYEREKIEIADNRNRPQDAPVELKGSGEFRSYHLADFEEKSEDFDRMMRHGYMACVSYVDKLTGDVIAELERLGLAENTIVVIWGDHGFHLGEHGFWGKHNTMHLATRVPLIVAVPGMKAGSSASLVESSDIFPTLCSLAGIAVPDTVQGRSFAALLDEPDQPFREGAYSRFMAADAVITERFSYTSYHGGKSGMLYDLEKDPDENINVAGNEEYRDDVRALEALLRQGREEAERFGNEGDRNQ
jgi:iduronate 2-sulfatase